MTIVSLAAPADDTSSRSERPATTRSTTCGRGCAGRSIPSPRSGPWPVCPPRSPAASSAPPSPARTRPSACSTRCPARSGRLATAITDAHERCRGELRGPVLWSETLSARASTFGDENLYVCVDAVAGLRRRREPGAGGGAGGRARRRRRGRRAHAPARPRRGRVPPGPAQRRRRPPLPRPSRPRRRDPGGAPGPGAGPRPRRQEGPGVRAGAGPAGPGGQPDHRRRRARLVRSPHAGAACGCSPACSPVWRRSGSPCHRCGPATASSRAGA